MTIDSTKPITLTALWPWLVRHKKSLKLTPDAKGDLLLTIETAGRGQARVAYTIKQRGEHLAAAQFDLAGAQVVEMMNHLERGTP